MKLKPQHFDLLGLIAFGYITAFAFYALLNGGVEEWSVKLLAAIGIVGFLIDAIIAFRYFVQKKK